MLYAAVVAALLASTQPKASPQSTPLAVQTQGCMGEGLFNGVWALRVLSITSGVTYNDGVDTQGIGINLQVRNATAHGLRPDQTGFSDINGTGIKLTYSDGKTVDLTIAGSPAEVLFDHRLEPGETASLAFYFPYSPKSHAAQPVKLVIPVNGKSRGNQAKVGYDAGSPSFSIDLSCKK